MLIAPRGMPCSTSVGAPVRQQVPPAGRRRRHQQCRAESGSGPGLPSREDMQARINKARQYKKSADPEEAAKATMAAGEAAAAAAARARPAPAAPRPQAAAQLPPQPAAAFIAPAPEGSNPDRAFGEAAQQLAAREQEQFLQAVSEASAAAASRSSAAAATAASSSTAAPAPPGTAAASSSKEALLARINAARQYNKQQPGAASSSSSDTSSSGSGGSSSAPATTPPPPAPAPPAAAPAAAAAASPEAAPAAAASSAAGPPAAAAAAAAQAAAQAEAEEKRSFRTGAGSADQAANWLIYSDSNGGDGGAGGGTAQQIDKNLSAEQFTIAKEELKKRQQVEIISVDAGYGAQVRREVRREQGGGEEAEAAHEEEGQAGGSSEGSSGGQEGEEGELHKPKVDSWGVFPRPRNISEAYGGGRNLKPGQALESEEAAAERKQRVATALQGYRKSLGLDVDPLVERQAQELYQEGNALFEQGLLSIALPKFAAAAGLMPLRTRLGGETRLQQALCLDSLGRNQEAYDIYVKIESHSAPGVAKKAKRMLFGWKAAESLKTTRISYQPTSSQWKRFFDNINKNSVYAAYVAGEGEAEEGGSGGAVAGVVAVSVILLPLAALAAALLMR